MKLNKILIFLFVVVLFVAVATSCGETHEHSFSAWETVAEPTCTAFGINERACECGKTEYKTVAATAHTPVIDAAVSATCTTTGKTEGSHCGVCGATITAQTETERVAHSFSEWKTFVAATCTVFGLNERSCECGQTEYATVAALSHSPVTDDAVGMTCTTDGKTEGSHCDRCGDVIVAQKVIAATGHNCNDVSVIEEALCNSDGTKRFSCTNDGCSYYYDESFSREALSGDELYNTALQFTAEVEIYGHFGEFLTASSAFILSSDGKVVVSNFRIDNAYSAVVLYGGEYYEVTEVLAYSARSAIAVLKIDATDLPCATLCTETTLDGEEVYSAGYLEYTELSISSGIISNHNLVINGVNYIQHDADMSPGYAGGPLLNRFGEVVGVNVAYIEDSGMQIHLAADMSELMSLDYSNPMPIAEYGAATFTPEEQLINWVLQCGNVSTENSVAYVLEGDSFYYALGYDQSRNKSFIEGFWVKDSKYQVAVQIFFGGDVPGMYEYRAGMTDGVWRSEVTGFIEAATFNASTMLTYDTFTGRYWSESELMAIYSESAYETLEWFSICLDTYFNNLTLESFGFTSLSYDRDEDALEKLNRFIMTYGVYDANKAAYVLSGGSQMGSDVMFFDFYYFETGDTVVSVRYALANGTTYRVNLTLNPHENGNRFEFELTAYNGVEDVVQNSAWGYIDATMFIATSEIFCYEFEGLSEYEDALLAEYAYLLNYMMKLLNNSALPSVDPNLTVADLGFFFYFG